MLVIIHWRLHPHIFPIRAIIIRMNPAIKKGKGIIIPDLVAGMHIVLSLFSVYPSGQSKIMI